VREILSAVSFRVETVYHTRVSAFLSGENDKSYKLTLRELHKQLNYSFLRLVRVCRWLYRVYVRSSPSIYTSQSGWYVNAENDERAK